MISIQLALNKLIYIDSNLYMLIYAIIYKKYNTGGFSRGDIPTGGFSSGEISPVEFPTGYLTHDLKYAQCHMWSLTRTLDTSG